MVSHPTKQRKQFSLFICDKVGRRYWFLWSPFHCKIYYDNHFGDIWDITAFGALVLTQLDPEYAELDLKLLFKRLNQTYETWLPDSGIGIFKRDYQSQKNQENVEFANKHVINCITIIVKNVLMKRVFVLCVAKKS